MRREKLQREIHSLVPIKVLKHMSNAMYHLGRQKHLVKESRQSFKKIVSSGRGVGREWDQGGTRVGHSAAFGMF